MLWCNSHGSGSLAVTRGSGSGWTGRSRAVQSGQAWPGNARSPSQALPLETHGAGQGEGLLCQPW